MIVCQEPGLQAEPRPAGMTVSYRTNRIRLGAWPNFLAALDTGVATGADHILMAQDDITLAAGTRRVLDRGYPAGVVSLYTPGNLKPFSWWRSLPRASMPEGTHGACCYVFARDVATALIANPPRPAARTRVDFWVGSFAKARGLRFWQHSPSFVQHVGETSTIHSSQRLTRSRVASNWAIYCA